MSVLAAKLQEYLKKSCSVFKAATEAAQVPCLSVVRSG